MPTSERTCGRRASSKDRCRAQAGARRPRPARSVCQVGGLDVFSAPADVRAGRPADRRRPDRAYSGWFVAVDLLELAAVMRARQTELPAVEVESGTGGVRASITKTICAFANLPGSGLIVVGLVEAGGFAPVGLESAGTLSAGIASRARHAFEPQVRVSVDIEAFEDAGLVIARVHELPASTMPCVVKRIGRAYLRFTDVDPPARVNRAGARRAAAAGDRRRHR